MKRINWVDSAKGIGIILVLLGHSQFREFNDFIYAFHMPLFYIISGYIWNAEKYAKITPPQLIYRKSVSYLVPYLKISFICLLLFGIFLPIIQNLIFTPEWKSQFFKYLKGIFLTSRGTTEFLPNCSPIWFLTCIFFAEIFLYYILKYIKPSFHILGIIILLFLSYITTKTGKLWWNIDNAFIATVFMYIGYLLRKFEDKKQYITCIFCLCVILSFIFGVPEADYDGNNLPDLAMNILFALGVSLFIFKFSKVIDNKILRFYGKNTILIFGYNYVGNSITLFLMNRLGINSRIMSFVIVLLIMTTFVLLIEKTQLNKIKKFICVQTN